MLHLLFFWRRKTKNYILSTVLLCLTTNAFSADIVINFCPVTKIQASKDWSATMQIQNNSGVVLDFANNKMTFNWPSLVSLQWPFSNMVQSGTNWSFNINLPFPGTLAVGATATQTVQGNQFSGVLQFPTAGTFVQGGHTYTVEVKNCNQTQNFELYDASFDFKRECFIYSPSKLCLGQAATEIWRGEGVFDAMIPTDRPSWAISVMVAHRLFTNLVGFDIISPNFWMATAMNESRMTCDPTISPNLTGGHCPINTIPNICTGIYNPTSNCFQMLNIGYSQISNNQPDLFAQTNVYGTASYSNVADNGNWETSALAVAYYHYQNIRYWSQIYCFNIPKTWKDAKDPYAIEKIFYHAYHDGPNAGVSLLNAITANYTVAVNAANMNTVINTGGTWSQIAAGGSSQKVGNFTSLLDGGPAHLYPWDKADTTTQFLGCYNAPIKWTDVVFYLNKIKILYPKLQNAPIQAAIKTKFDAIKGGANVNFEDLGPVIDEIVIQMGGHDPSKYIATQFAGSKTCPTNALGVSLRTNDTICPGTTGKLQVWLSGDTNFKFTLKYPDGSLHTFSNVSYSPFIVFITQPGNYEVIYFEDKKEVGDLNCLFSKIKVQSKNGNVVNWDKSSIIGTDTCTDGPLVIKNTGSGSVTVSYTHNGGAAQNVNIPAGTTSYTISTSPASGQYIITNMLPNACGTPVNDTINICTPCAKPNAIITGTASICLGDSTQLSVTLSGGTGPYTIKINDGTTNWKVKNIITSPYIFYAQHAGTFTIDSVWNSGCDSKGTGSATIVVNSLPIVTANTTSSTICAGSKVTLTGGGTANTYSWSGGVKDGVSFAPTATATYTVIGTNTTTGCKNLATITITVSPIPIVTTNATASTVCQGSSVTLSAFASGASVFLWSNASSTSSIIVSPTATTVYSVTVSNGSCQASATTTVTITNAITASINSPAAICANTNVTLNALPSGASAYLWSNNQTTSSITVSPITTTAYSLTVTVGTCPPAYATTTLTVNQNPIASVSADITIMQGQSANLIASGGTIYIWNNNMTGANISVSPLSTTNYCVTVYDANNCHDTACTTVFIEHLSGSFYLPNAFSPNGDNENDNLRIYYDNSDYIKSLHLVIYNRLGEKVYETSDPAFKWNGNYNQITKTEGTEVFVYYLKATFINGEQLSKRGNISLLR